MDRMRALVCVAACVWMSTSPAAFAPGWTTQKGAGFSVDTPPEWNAFPDAHKGWVHLMGSQGEDVVIWPVFLPGAPGALDLKTAQVIHQKLAEACPYHAEWEPPTAAGQNMVRARGRSGELTAISAFAWKPTPRGIAGYFYLAGARAADFAKKTPDLVRILQSFRLAPAEADGSGGIAQYASFQDPLEGAFMAEVPAGWQAGGGMFRSSPDDPHLALGVTSPDGQTKIRLGDPQMSTWFMEPNGMLPEGTMNGSMMILRYLSGAYFCQFFVSRNAPMVCSDLQITEMRDNPEMVQQVLSMDPSLAQTPFTIGSVNFQCREQGQLRTGFCQAVTHRLALPMGGQAGMWRVHSIRSYLTPPDRVEQTKAIMHHMSESIRFNPQWGRQEIQNAGVRSGIISGAANQIGDMAAAAQRNRDAVNDRIAQMRSDATLGVVRLADPATGRQMTVDSGANYYWVDPAGRIVGTQVDALPGADFRRLFESPVR